MMKTFSTIALLLTFALAVRAAEIGKPAPEFTGTNIHGKAISLADYKGKIVVIESYNSDCPFCHNHYGSGAAQELQKELADKGVVWLLVNSVNPKNMSHRTAEQAQTEWKELKIAATAWIDDSSGDIGRAYEMKTTPHVFIVDKSGNLAYDGAMDNNPKPFGDPRKAKNYVRNAVEELLADKPVSVSKTKPYGCAVHY